MSRTDHLTLGGPDSRHRTSLGNSALDSETSSSSPLQETHSAFLISSIMALNC